jgi:Dolichyl-phosphate-mannose-protein mannosyltransferase
MAFLQDWIHGLEQGTGARFFKIAAAGLAVLALGLAYDLREYRNFSTPEAMDSAQLARNIAEGKGYTTLFIRPFSLYLVKSHNEARLGGTTNADTDFAEIKTMHPDLANPPVYPLALAGLMKTLPFDYTVQTNAPFWSDNGKFYRYQPDFLIAVFNEVLLLVVVALTFFLARKLFDAHVAWLSAILVLGCDLLWQFSVSGLSTILLLIIFLGLAWCILKIEALAREPQPRAGQLLAWAAAAGALAGVGVLTRYAFGWVIIPVLVFLVLFGGQRRILHALAALGAFAVFLTPWVIRNYTVSGTPFGVAGFAVAKGTFMFPGFQLERSIHPDLTQALWFSLYIHKLLTNVSGILANDLPKLGGSWVSMLFLAGLLLGFRGAAARRMRHFLLMCLGMFIVIQALGQTEISHECPVVNTENLLVLLAPLVFIYGVGFFHTCLEQMNLEMRGLRHIVIGVFAGVCCLPMIFTLLSKTSPVAYPPYNPPAIQLISGWMGKNELIMSDIPWAVAWYGQRQSVWLTLDTKDDFFAINDYMKPVEGLYLTPETMNGRFLSDWLRGGKNGWGHFVLQAISQGQIPKDFPLRHAPAAAGFLPDSLFLSDWNRWGAKQ